MRKYLYLTLLTLVFEYTPYALAQSLTLTAPLQNITVTEGDDYATDVLQNSWDFNERRDVGWEDNYLGQSVGTANGVWSGVNEVMGAHVYPLFGGFYGSLLAEGLSGDKSLPRFGANHPIDTNKYYYLSYKLNHSNRGTYAVYWRTSGAASYWPDGSQFGANYDGTYLSQAIPNSGYQVYQFDLRSPKFEQQSGSWSGSVVALRVDPSVSGPAGSLTQFDWMRLVDPESAPTVSITWQSSSIPQGAIVTVWLDTDASGYDGTPIARYAQGSNFPAAPGGSLFSTNSTPYRNTGVHQLKTAMLPPGDYYLYVTAHQVSGTTLTQVAQSGYSARLRVRAAPEGYFIAPSETSGVDYATSELGNAWDMNDAADVANLPGSSYPPVQRQFSNSGFVGGVFQATADSPLYSIGNVQSDAQVYMPGPPTRPIKPARYRYLTYRMAIDEALYPSAESKAANGCVSRPVYWDGDLFGSGGSAKAHMVYEGYHTYTIDLWDSSAVESGQPWLALSNIRQFRIDPLETTAPTWFYIDWAKLSAPDSPATDIYSVRFSVSDVDSTALSVSVYIDSDKQGFDGTWIASLSNVSPGEHTVGWNVNGYPDGAYFPYLEISDGSQIHRVYASAPVVIGGASVAASSVPYDYNGDGKSDPIVFRPSDGLFYVNKTVIGPTVTALGPVGGFPVEGDFDGDGVSDVATVSSKNGILYWLVQFSSNHGISYRPWGVLGDIPVVGDYNGDKRDDLAVYRNGLWYVTFEDGTVQVGAWGYPGDIPIASDFDGDGRVDYAIWRNGDWWVLFSGFVTGHASDYFLAQQWGLPGDVPLAEDITGDGKVDFIVWRPADGNWYVRDSQSGDVAITQWGLPGDIPLLGNFVGTSMLDFTVWRPSNGLWFSRDETGNVSIAQWGLPADAVPQ